MMASKYNWNISAPKREVTLSIGGPHSGVSNLNIRIQQTGETYISTSIGQGITVDNLDRFIDMLKDAKAAAASYFTER